MHFTFEAPTTPITRTYCQYICARYSVEYDIHIIMQHNIFLFSTKILIETKFACTQWTYGSFGDTTVLKISIELSIISVT